jgi:hypothetical protein
MFDEGMLGATLEAPETFGMLSLPLWPRLLRTIGYQGTARWVALYMKGDYLLHHDGAGTGTGDSSLFLAFKRHLMVAPHLAVAHLGSAEEEAREWLVIDTHHQVVYLAPCNEARRFLAAQWPHYESVPAEHTEEERARLMKAWQEGAAPSDWAEHEAEAMRERQTRRCRLRSMSLTRGRARAKRSFSSMCARCRRGWSDPTKN